MSQPGLSQPDSNANTTNAILLNLVQALNNLNQTLAKTFPQAEGISGAAGAATGDYLPVTIGGVTYKLALLADT